MPYKDYQKQKEYQRQWISDRRAKFFKDKECARKDETCEGSLQLDHKNPAKKWKHRIWSYSWDNILKETKKCQVLCASHHYRKTAEDVRKMRAEAHGTLEGYEKWHCRCDRCIKFYTSSQDEYTAGLSPEDAKMVLT